MVSLDRPAIIELLGRLGAESEQTVVQAARELHAKVGESGSDLGRSAAPGLGDRRC